MKEFLLALSAGHGRNTAGKRCSKALDSAQTREWVLNDRIADKVEVLLHSYAGVRVLRVDDTTGEKDVSLEARTAAANAFSADFYLSLHHNAGILGGKGGGIVAYVHPAAEEAAKLWQQDLYSELIGATGLKGNRATPLAKRNLKELRLAKMPAALLELGFMDSRTDVPIILSEEYADRCAEAIVRVIARRAGLVKLEDSPAGIYEVASPDGVLNLRTGPGAGHDLLEALPNCSKLGCFGQEQAGWLKVVARSGKIGWVNRKYLIKT